MGRKVGDWDGTRVGVSYAFKMNAINKQKFHEAQARKRVRDTLTEVKKKRSYGGPREQEEEEQERKQKSSSIMVSFNDGSQTSHQAKRKSGKQSKFVFSD